MPDSGRDLAELFYRAAGEPVDIDGLAALYAPDALLIRFDGTSTGTAEIVAFFRGFLARHQPYELHTLEQVTHAGDVVMWDAVVSTAQGMLETTEVMVLDDAGLIKRHIPGIRGYWGL